MTYKLIVTEHADELLDNLVHHLLYHLKNQQAAKHYISPVGKIQNKTLVPYHLLEKTSFRYR